MSVRTHARRKRRAGKRPVAASAKIRKRGLDAPRGARGQKRVEYRSKFEQGLRQSLDNLGVEYGYETRTFDITLPVSGYCSKCGKYGPPVVRDSVYTPDFFFKTWVIEAKGKFTAKDRKRVLALLSANPKPMRFGMLFMRDNKLSKSSKTRYSQWCEKNGIAWAVSWFKQEWMR